MLAERSAAPSKPHLTDEYEPTNKSLWEAVLNVARGQASQLTQGDRTINAPNNGKGFYPWPHPQGTAWAVKQYKGFGGNWRAKASAQLDFMAQGAVIMTRTATREHKRMEKLAKRRLVTSQVVEDRHYWSITPKGESIVHAMRQRNQV